jgi:hypothetical protein
MFARVCRRITSVDCAFVSICAITILQTTIFVWCKNTLIILASVLSADLFVIAISIVFATIVNRRIATTIVHATIFGAEFLIAAVLIDQTTLFNLFIFATYSNVFPLHHDRQQQQKKTKNID